MRANNPKHISHAAWKRYWRKKADRGAEAVARAVMRRILPRRERKRQKALEEAFATTLRYAQKNENGRMSATATLFNIGLYLLIAHRDIQAVKIDALTHPDEWTRKLNARVLLLTIYEWDTDEVTGKALRDALDQMLISGTLKREAIESIRRLRKIQERTKSKFSFIRNAAIAHRDPNALVQYRAIRDLRVREVVDMAAEFFGETGVFISVLTKILAAGDNLDSYLRQWSASGER